MFMKHPLRDALLFVLIGVTVTFAFNVQAVETHQDAPFSATFLAWEAAY